MAKKKIINASNDPSISPQDIIANTYMPLNEKWAVEFLKYAYGTTPVNFFYANKLNEYRDIDKGKINVGELKRFFDPEKNIREDERAALMRTNWMPCPLIHSLNQIIQKNIENIPVELKVNSSDKISINKKHQQKLKLKSRRYLIEVINYIKSLTGDPPIDYDTDIDEFVNSNGDATETNLSLLESMKNEVSDDVEFNMLNEAGFIKDGVEISHEQMIDYYFNKVKFKTNLSYKIISDLMKVSAYCYRYYTNAINGKPEVQYVDIGALKTSYFDHRDAHDMDYAYFTFTCTWAEYMMIVGGKLTPEHNQKIYNANRQFLYNNMNYVEFGNPYNPSIMDYQITLGYFEAKKHEYDPITKKYADVIKKFYYLPLSIDLMREDFILDLGNLQDMHRYGDKKAECNFSFIIYKDKDVQSFYDVQKPDYLRMNLIYNQILNTFANFIPEGTAFVEETIRELAEEIQQEQESKIREMGGDISNITLSNVMSEVIKNYVQSGRGIFKMRKGDRNEERLDRPTFVMENKILQNCNQLIGLLFSVYQQMLMSLGINQNRLAQDPRPHQTLTGIEMATNASYFSTQNLEDGYVFALKSFGERMLYYDQLVITEVDKNGMPKTERAEEMKAIIGSKGYIWLEVYRDMPEQNSILSIENLPSDKDRMRLLAQTAMYEQIGKVPTGTSIIIEEIKNIKLAKMFVVMMIKRQERIAIDNQQKLIEAQAQGTQMQQQQQVQEKQIDADIEARLMALETQLKTAGQKEIKEKINENRLSEQANAAELELQKKAREKEMEKY